MSFNLTRKTDYALVALASLARNKAHSGELFSARHIAESYDLPLPLLMNALKKLHRAEIICSRRGAAGGYYLCREPEEITLKEIIEAMEGPVHLTICSDEHQDEECMSCHIAALCPISTPMNRLNDFLNMFLTQITLKNLVSKETLKFPNQPGVSI